MSLQEVHENGPAIALAANIASVNEAPQSHDAHSPTIGVPDNQEASQDTAPDALGADQPLSNALVIPTTSLNSYTTDGTSDHESNIAWAMPTEPFMQDDADEIAVRNQPFPQSTLDIRKDRAGHSSLQEQGQNSARAVRRAARSDKLECYVCGKANWKTSKGLENHLRKFHGVLMFSFGGRTKMLSLSSATEGDLHLL